jgi:hypothetical protein
MGTIFEELIRKFNEALDENPGEHFTPRDVVHLMVDLMLAGAESEIRAKKDSPAGRWLRGSPNRSKLDQPHRTLGRPSMESTA